MDVIESSLPNYVHQLWKKNLFQRLEVAPHKKIFLFIDGGIIMRKNPKREHINCRVKEHNILGIPGHID